MQIQRIRKKPRPQICRSRQSLCSCTAVEEMEKLDKVSELASEYPGWMVARQSEVRGPES